jgi:hypothetical protein
MSRNALISLLLAVNTTGCGGKILAQYEQARLEALADPGPVPATWSPDGELGLSWGLVTTLAVRELQQRLESPDSRLRIELPLGAEAILVPDLTLRDTEIGPAKACDTCVKVTAGFEGELDWKLASFGGSIPVSLDVKAVLAMITRSEGAHTVVEAELKRVTVALPDGLQVDRIKVDLNDPLASWIQEQVEREFPPIPLAELGTDEVPLRAVRLDSGDDYLLVRVLTTSPTRSQASLVPRPGGDWYLSLDEQVLLGLARREAFEAGELELDIHADPRSLAVDQQAFTMGLRLWRLAGAGWWRDYEITGTIDLEDDELRLTPSAVEELEHSRGAGLADPLALLAQGMILEAIAGALEVARPAQLEQPIGGATLSLTVDQAIGAAGALSLQGSSTIQQREQGKEKPQGSGKGKKKSKSRR